MQVPFDPNPVTNPPDTTLSLSRFQPVDTTQGVGQDLQQLGGDVRQEQVRRQMLDTTNAYLTEVNQREGIMQDGMVNAPPGAHNFTQDLMTQFQQRDQALQQKYLDAGYDPQVVDQMTDRLDRYNNMARYKAFNFQQGAVRDNAKLTSQDTINQVADFVSKNPTQESVDSGLETLHHGIYDLNPDLEAGEKDLLYKQGEQIIRTQARTGFAMLHPDEVLQSYDQNGMLKQDQGPAGAPVSAPGTYGLQDYVNAIAGHEGTGKNPNSSAVGYGQFVGSVAHPGTFAQVYRQTFPDQAVGLTDAQLISKRGTLGPDGQPVEHAMLATFTQNNIHSLQAAQIPVTPANVFLAHFLGFDGASKALASDPSTPIAAIDPAAVASNHFLAGMTVQQVHDWAGQQMAARMPQTAPAPTTADGTTPVAGAPASGLTLQNKTGNAILDSADATEALRMISIAKSITDQRNVQANAATEVQHQNFISEATTTGGQPATPMPTLAQLTAARGPVLGQQAYEEQLNAVRNGQFLKTMGGVNTQQGWTLLASMKPKPGSPTYATDMKDYAPLEKAWTAALAYRQQDPQNYVFDNNPQIRQQLANAKTPQDLQAAYTAVNAAYDKLGLAPQDRNAFPATAEPQIIADYNSKSATQKFQQISTWQQTMPAPMFQNALGFLAKNGAATDVTMYQIMHDNPGYQGTAGQVMAGLDALKADKSREQFTPVISAQFHNTIGPVGLQAMAPTVSHAFDEAAMALYVARGGTATKDGVQNKALYTEALRQAVGGQAGNVDTGWYNMPGTTSRQADPITSIFMNTFGINAHQGPGKFSGATTILPAGVTGTQFQNWIDKGGLNNYWQLSDGKAPAVAATGHIANALDIANNGVLVMTEPGRYAVYSKLDGKQLITHQGTPYILNINRQTVLGQ